MSHAWLGDEANGGPALSNEELVEEWRAGDVGAFRSLVRRCSPLVREPLAYLIRDPAQAEQASIRVFMRMFEMGRRFHPDVSVAVWLVRQALAEGVPWWRKQGSSAPAVALSAPAAMAGDLPPVDRMGERLGRLKLEVFTPLMLRYLCGLSLNMTADVLAKPIDFVVGKLYVGLCEAWNIPSGKGGSAECREVALAERLEGVLREDQVERVDAHIVSCPRCAERFSSIADAARALTAYGERGRYARDADLWQLFRDRCELSRQEGPKPRQVVNRLVLAAAVLGIVTLGLLLSQIPRAMGWLRAGLGEGAQVAQAPTAGAPPTGAAAQPRGQGTRKRLWQGPPGALTRDDLSLTPPELPVPLAGVGSSARNVAVADVAAGSAPPGIAVEVAPDSSDEQPDESADSTPADANVTPSGVGPMEAEAPPPPVVERPAPRPATSAAPGTTRPSPPSVPRAEPARPAGQAPPSKDLTARMLERAYELAPESGR